MLSVMASVSPLRGLRGWGMRAARSGLLRVMVVPGTVRVVVSPMVGRLALLVGAGHPLLLTRGWVPRPVRRRPPLSGGERVAPPAPPERRTVVPGDGVPVE